MSRAAELLRGRRVLVTGATGFLGSHMVAALRGVADVHAVSRRPQRPESGVTPHVADLADRGATAALFSTIRPELTVHLAGFADGKQGIENLHPSLMGDLVTTVHVLEAGHAAGCERLVMTGSLEEPDCDGAAASPYAVSKHAAGQYADLCHRLYGLPVATVRVFVSFGPRQSRRKFLPQLIETLARGERFGVRSAEREADWIYVDDVTEALALAAARPGLAGKTVDAGSGALTSVKELAETTARLMGREDLVDVAPPDRQDERIRVADVGETERVLGWRPRVSLVDGLQRTVEAFACREVVR